MYALLASCLLFMTSAQAGIPAVSFFRQPDSLFPSGQANPSELIRRKVRDFQEINYLIQKENQSLKLPTNYVLRDMDLSLKLAHAKTGASGLVIGTKGPWAAVISGPKNQRSWWSLNEVLPIPDDRGLAIPLSKVLLRAEPTWKTNIVEELAPMTRLRVLSFSDDWLEVSVLTEPLKKGYVDIGSMILKYDFASFILPKNGKWVPVRYRQGRFMITGLGEKVPLENIVSMMTRPDLGVMAKTVEGRGILMRSFVTIKNWESITWAVSQVAGHGEVFWKMDGNIKPGPERAPTTVLSFEEILKKPIFSVSFHPQNPRMGVISAEGIFITTDGLNWRRVEFFQNDNLPVAISPNHEIFVGHYRSSDQGRSFMPFLKWEQVASIVEGKSNKVSRILRLVKVNPRADKKIEIEVDTGAKVTHLLGSTRFGLVTEWKSLTK